MKPKAERKNESNSHPNDAQRLKNFRCIFKFSQTQAAEFLGVPVSSYRAYEANRLPVPVKLRRTIGSLSPVDILPMNPDQDPKDVYAVIRNAQPDDFSDKLRELLPMSAQAERPIGQKQLVARRIGKGLRGLRLFDFDRKHRDHVQAQRRKVPTLRRVYCEWRDASFLASAIFLLFWIGCLQLSIPLSIFAEAANVVGVGSLAVFFLLVTAVSQDIVFDK